MESKNLPIETVHCLIIGSGPAGYTAAIYAARANMQPVMYEGLQPGGQLTTTTEVENFPGYPLGVHGTAMMEDLRNQALRFETDIRSGFATGVEFSTVQGGTHRVMIEDQKIIETKVVIIATGASAKYLGLPSEQKFLENGGGVSACAVCDGFFYKGKNVAIVGAGDSACEEAIYLSKICKKVTMIVRKEVMRASAVMQKRVLQTPNIEVKWNTETLEILGNQVVEGARLRIQKNNQISEETIAIDGFFVAIGHTPNTAIFKPILQMNEVGYIVPTTYIVKR